MFPWRKLPACDATIRWKLTPLVSRTMLMILGVLPSQSGAADSLLNARYRLVVANDGAVVLRYAAARAAFRTSWLAPPQVTNSY